MKRIASAYPFLPLILSLCCAGMNGVTHGEIRGEMRRMADMIRSSPNASGPYRDKSSNSGIYYVIDNNGTVIRHPKAFLIGGSFGSNRFVQKILEKKSGCLSYGLGGNEITVFFLPLDGSLTLCFSIPSGELRGGEAECTKLGD